MEPQKRVAVSRPKNLSTIRFATETVGDRGAIPELNREFRIGIAQIREFLNGRCIARLGSDNNHNALGIKRALPSEVAINRAFKVSRAEGLLPLCLVDGGSVPVSKEADYIDSLLCLTPSSEETDVMGVIELSRHLHRKAFEVLPRELMSRE